MRQMLLPIGALCVLLAVGLAAPLAAPAPRDQDPCDQIKAACERRLCARCGSQRQRAPGWTASIPSCREAISRGGPRKPLPQVDPQLVAACRASNPGAGNGRTPAAEPVAQPVPASPPAVGALGAANAEKRPNIVFILTDDLSWNLVQYMPHVLQMQQQGTTFSHYFVTDSLCCPSRSSIFTGTLSARYRHLPQYRQ